MNKKNLLLAGIGFVLALPMTVAAGEWYIGGSLGYNMQADSSNSGDTGTFTTGNGSPAVPFGTSIPSGTNYGWDTSFDGGIALSAEAGLMYNSGFRSGIELTFSNADVDSHSGVTLGGTTIDGVDAAVLTGSRNKSGASVGQVVADGRGDISSYGVFANLYYDFNKNGMIEPYLGVGIGFMSVDVDYSPSNVGIIDDSDKVFAYQLKAGATYNISSNFGIYGEYAYRASEDIEVNNDLFPGSLDIENEQHIFSVGLRYKF